MRPVKNKKTNMKPIAILTALLFTFMGAVVVASITGANPYLCFAFLLLAGLLPTPKGVALMPLQKEIWQNDILGNLFKDNAFAQQGTYNADQFVLSGKVVHIPVAGAPAVIAKNLTSFPQTAVKRADSELVYSLDTLYALPRQIERIEQYELSYDKRQSVVGEDTSALIQNAMDSLLYRWAPAAANVIETSGADSNADLLASATGTRKLFTKVVFGTIVKKLSNANLGNMRKIAVLTANHYYQLLESFTDAEKTDFGRVVDLSTGRIGTYLGVEVYMRSTVLRYRKVSSVWTVVDEQDAGFVAGAGDSAASLFWADNCVERAVGDVHVFDDTNNPLYYGDVFSAQLRIGGRIRRTVGVHAVVEAIGA